MQHNTQVSRYLVPLSNWLISDHAYRYVLPAVPTPRYMLQQTPIGFWLTLAGLLRRRENNTRTRVHVESELAVIILQGLTRYCTFDSLSSIFLNKNDDEGCIARALGDEDTGAKGGTGIV